MPGEVCELVREQMRACGFPGRLMPACMVDGTTDAAADPSPAGMATPRKSFASSPLLRARTGPRGPHSIGRPHGSSLEQAPSWRFERM